MQKKLSKLGIGPRCLVKAEKERKYQVKRILEIIKSGIGTKCPTKRRK